jgi:hypothetical protein
MPGQLVPLKDHEQVPTVRVHDWVWVELLLPHVPPPHVYVVTLRLWVPVVSHVLAKPLHVLHAP